MTSSCAGSNFAWSWSDNFLSSEDTTRQQCYGNTHWVTIIFSMQSAALDASKWARRELSYPEKRLSDQEKRLSDHLFEFIYKLLSYFLWRGKHVMPQNAASKCIGENYPTRRKNYPTFLAQEPSNTSPWTEIVKSSLIDAAKKKITKKHTFFFTVSFRILPFNDIIDPIMKPACFNSNASVRIEAAKNPLPTFRRLPEVERGKVGERKRR